MYYYILLLYLLQEFTVMPNGEVTQFEYTAQSEIANQIGDYNLSLNSFCTSDAMVKVESLTFNDNRRNFNEVEIIENKAYTCNQCGVSFSRPNALTTHEKTHNVKTWATPIECKYCDKQFQDENHLSTHQQTCAKRIMQNCSEQGLPNSRWGKHACSECGKKFTTKQKMFRHQWIHRYNFLIYRSTFIYLFISYSKFIHIFTYLPYLFNIYS